MGNSKSGKTKYRTRDSQRTSGLGLGIPFTSPIKKKLGRKDRQKAVSYAAQYKRAALEAQLDKYINKPAQGTSGTQETPIVCDSDPLPPSDAMTVDGDTISTPELGDQKSEKPVAKKPRQSYTTTAKRAREYDRWAAILPSLAASYLGYNKSRIGKPKSLAPTNPITPTTPCTNARCRARTKNTLCLLTDRE